MSFSLRTRTILWFVGLSAVLLVGFSLALYGATRRSLIEGLDEVVGGEIERLASRIEFEGSDLYIEPRDPSGDVEGNPVDERSAWIHGSSAYRLDDARRLEVGVVSGEVEDPAGGGAGLAPDERPEAAESALTVEGNVQARLDVLARRLVEAFGRGALEPTGITDLLLGDLSYRVHWHTLHVVADLEDVIGDRLEVEEAWPADAAEMQAMIERQAAAVELPEADLLVLAAGSYGAVDVRLLGLSIVLLSVVPLALLVAVGFGWFFAGRIVRPVAAIATAAERIQAEGTTASVPTWGRGDEIDRLAATLNEAFARLRGAFARQTRFTADAAHELRTPLATIRAEAQVALNRERAAADYREALAGVDRAADRLQKILEALLLLARSDARSIHLDAASVDLGELVRDVAGEFASEAAGRDIELSVVEAEGPFPVPGNGTLLGILARNLIENALRYTAAGGHVSVRIEETRESVRLAVIDDGEGIAPEKIEHLFERFYRVDEARSRERGGAGLGLAVVETIVELHAGRVTVDSLPGRGTTVTVDLPRVGGSPNPG